MKILSDKSYRDLVDSRHRALARARKAEIDLQQLILDAGLRGFEVVLRPEVPAVPARLTMKPFTPKR